MAFNVTARSQQRIMLAARLNNQTPAAFMRDIVEAQAELQLKGTAAATIDESERAAG